MSQKIKLKIVQRDLKTRITHHLNLSNPIIKKVLRKAQSKRETSKTKINKTRKEWFNNNSSRIIGEYKKMR
jgi:hypothetical protein